jgi:hypothetical protein
MARQRSLHARDLADVDPEPDDLHGLSLEGVYRRFMPGVPVHPPEVAARLVNR